MGIQIVSTEGPIQPIQSSRGLCLTQAYPTADPVPFQPTPRPHTAVSQGVPVKPTATALVAAIPLPVSVV